MKPAARKSEFSKCLLEQIFEPNDMSAQGGSAVVLLWYKTVTEIVSDDASVTTYAITFSLNLCTCLFSLKFSFLNVLEMY